MASHYQLCDKNAWFVVLSFHVIGHFRYIKIQLDNKA